MGGHTFETVGKGKDAKAAFSRAVDQARYDHGHAGYTGTIAEKHAFTIIPLPKDQTDPFAYARKLIDDSDPRVDDKWGPAGAIQIGNDEWLFFGWASS